MLKKLRIALATVMMTLVTLLLLDFTGMLHRWLGWVAKIQFLPALLALNVVVVIVLVTLTLLFGRIYCSVICPLGILQDLIAFRPRKKNRYAYSPAKKWLRYSVLAIFVVALIIGVNSLVALLAPYSSYGRIVQNMFQPIAIWINNLCSNIADHYGSYAFHPHEVWMRSLPTFIIAVVTFAVIAVLAWRGGRTYCNTICPVGTLLGFFSRISLFRVQFDADKCRQCGKCERNCKASAIDFKAMDIDLSRCVVCGNCVEQCNFDALHYKMVSTRKVQPAVSAPDNTASGTPADTSRRSFLVGAAIATASIAMAQDKKKVDGGLADVEDKLIPERQTPITPPGSRSAANMRTRCTGCQLCVSKCPNGVLRPSTGLLTLMQPTMSYERGYCRPECHTCSEVCPTGAIQPISLSLKSSIQVGHAVWIKKNCIPVANGTRCGNCARHCPVGAITMVPLDNHDNTSPMVPAVNEARCIGCGACEYLCPARPFSAIYVEGHEVHKEI